jgi:hypothetical protein
MSRSDDHWDALHESTPNTGPVCVCEWCPFANGVLFRVGCFCEWGCLYEWGCALRPVCLATGVPLESLLARGDTWSGLTEDRVVVVAKTVIQKGGAIKH